ncbi:AraC family transcriptional regulator [Pseudodesulfovibrio sp. zrk46]|uniref:AraC family transcriptional regulator n=1 Tax=Pseudodesulfovibrio sp. zrk46 TaxID=2725288 RepID=UPI001448E3E0|nr:AraC family transcriptional regulator [Pseudodesulfovibrio sp. zrk46]QJB55788.1 AraC family transcriptional regulator [Pseudodesulfovibrio sp. zrk46]
MSATIQSSQAKTLWKAIELSGHDPEPLFVEAGVFPADLSDPEKRILRSRMDGIWKRAAEEIDDPCFGLKMAEAWHPSHGHALGYLWLATSSLKDGLERLEKYSKLWAERSEFLVEDSGAGLTVTLSDSLMTVPQIEGFFAGMLKACRINFGNSLAPVSVELIRSQPPCASKFNEHFSCDVAFGAQRNCMTFSADDVGRKLDASNELMAELNEKIVTRQLRDMAEGGIVSDVEIALSRMISGQEHSDENIASELNMSTRTLQRKLKDAGTSYRKVLDDVRSKMANEYLKDKTLELLEVAFLLGYSEYSSFSRAFKRWTGTSPQELRAAC